MKDDEQLAQKIAWRIVPGPDWITVQADPAWLREDIIDLLRPLLAVLGNLITEEGQCRLCLEEYSHGRMDNGEPCPVPAALEAAS